MRSALTSRGHKYSEHVPGIRRNKKRAIVSAMFGAPMESIIPNPFVIIFTNEDVSRYYHYLSKDRWQSYAIIENELLAITKFEPHDQNSRFVKLTERKKKN